MKIRKIRHICMWLFMHTKRYLKKPMFVITVLMIPVLVIALRCSSGHDEAAIRAAVFVEESDCNDTAVQAAGRLIGNEGKVISFYMADSEEQIYSDVESGYAICGYVFPADFATELANYAANNTAELKYDGAIVKCIRKEETNYSKVSDEMVFNSLYDEFADDILVDFIKNSDNIDFSEEDESLLEQLKESYNISSELFAFEYIDGQENVFLESGQTSFLMLPLRGLIYTLILLSSMSGAIILYNDKERGMFQSIAMYRRGFINYIYVFIPAFISGVVGYIGIWLAGVFTDISRELIVMVLYIFLVAGICNFLRRICRKQSWFVSLIPVFIMANVIICPVFADISGILPGAKYIQSFLPVYYGLNCMYDFKTRIVTFIIIAVSGFVMIKDYE